MADANILTMSQQPIRRAAVAGSWYPATAGALRLAVRQYLAAAPRVTGADVRALIVPHAGLVYSGPVGAFAYAAVAGRSYQAVVLVGPSHYVAFDGVAVFARGAFETPFGLIPVAQDLAAAIQAASRCTRELPDAHTREHSLEMQLPFLACVLPGVPIVPLVMGQQRRETITDLAAALATSLAGRNVLLVASTDLSHYHASATAAALDGRVVDLVNRFDPDALVDLLERTPEHACGGGPVTSVMLAARDLGARQARVLRYADSGDVSGDKAAVVGYMAAVIGAFQDS
jgi:AmmeMemoRadiSam system protein B